MFWRERTENADRLCVTTSRVGKYLVISGRQLGPVSGIAAGFALRVLTEHEALGGGEVANQVGKGKHAVRGAPLEVIARNAFDHARGPGSNVLEVPKKLRPVRIIHTQKPPWPLGHKLLPDCLLALCPNLPL